MMGVTGECHCATAAITLWCFIALSAISVQSACGLQCYTCAGEDTNDNCNVNEPPVLQTCSASEDRCLTQVIYSSERGKLRIDKSCTSRDGCDAATKQLSKRYFCDKSRAGWGCAECCDTDRCNVNEVARPRATSAVVVGAFCSVAMLRR